MSFYLTVQLPGGSSTRGYSECTLASDALDLYRHLAKTRVRVIEIFDLRHGERRAITGDELEAIAQKERHERYRIVLRERGVDLS